jgi:(p)ppGpp synthase/HD superfamily hydrolase
MIYTPKIKSAIKFSIKTHDLYQKQKRKGKDIAYITHPLTVGIILSRAGASEEVVAAGILHDTIEDSIPEKKVTYEMLLERFGAEVADLVLCVTETDRDLPWDERKKDALEHIKTFSHDQLLLKSGDVLSNTSELVDDHTRYGDAVFKRFSVSKEKTLKHYLEAIRRIVERWEENPLTEDLREVAERLKGMQTG